MLEPIISVRMIGHKENSSTTCEMKKFCERYQPTGRCESNKFIYLTCQDRPKLGRDCSE